MLLGGINMSDFCVPPKKLFPNSCYDLTQRPLCIIEAVQCLGLL